MVSRIAKAGCNSQDRQWIASVAASAASAGTPTAAEADAAVASILLLPHCCCLCCCCPCPCCTTADGILLLPMLLKARSKWEQSFPDNVPYRETCTEWCVFIHCVLFKAIKTRESYTNSHIITKQSLHISVAASAYYIYTRTVIIAGVYRACTWPLVVRSWPTLSLYIECCLYCVRAAERLPLLRPRLVRSTTKPSKASVD